MNTTLEFSHEGKRVLAITRNSNNEIERVQNRASTPREYESYRNEMPDSWRDYGVDFDGDGKVDLRNSVADSIGSVANFLKQKGGWIPGQDVVYAAKFDTDTPKIKELLEKPIQPSLTIKEIKTFGISSPETIKPDVKLSLIDLPNGDKATTYVLGSQNFYAITRYNKSYMYAMSVYDLGSAVMKARSSAASK